MNEQPGLSTNLPWLLKDENTLEDESESEPRQIKPWSWEGVHAYLTSRPQATHGRGVAVANVRALIGICHGKHSLSR